MNMDAGTLDRLDLLVSRVVDGEATRAERDELSRLAELDGRVWKLLAEAHADHAALVRHVGSAVALAERVEAPVHELSIERLQSRSRLMGQWGGWAAAAAVLLAVAAGPRLGINGSAPISNSAGLVPTPTFADAGQALSTYLDQGKKEGLVVGEVPTRVLLEKRPLPEGGYEVVYLRQIIERAKVPGLYQAGIDELGRPAPVRLEVEPVSGQQID
jgi:hypothetical protein